MDKQGQIVFVTELEFALDCFIEVVDIIVVLGRYEKILLELDIIGEQVMDVIFLNDFEKVLSS